MSSAFASTGGRPEVFNPVGAVIPSSRKVILYLLPGKPGERVLLTRASLSLDSDISIGEDGHRQEVTHDHARKHLVAGALRGNA